MRSSARVHQRAGLVERLVALREEAVGHAVGERRAEPAAVREGRAARTGTASPVRVLLADPVRDRLHQRRRRRRPAADDRLGELDLEPVRASPSSSSRRASATSWSSPGGSRQSTTNSARAGITLIFSPRRDDRRRERDAERRLEHPRERAARQRRMRSTAAAGIGGILADRLEEARAARRPRHSPARPAPIRSSAGSELEQRVVRERGDRRVARAAAGAHAEAERAFLGAPDAVEAPVAERHHRAAALVDEPVDARGVGPLLGQPLRAERARPSPRRRPR